jgi:hypothetical protein
MDLNLVGFNFGIIIFKHKGRLDESKSNTTHMHNTRVKLTCLVGLRTPMHLKFGLYVYITLK